MALKLTTTAAETLNDILLHTLQEAGLEKAEALEQQLFDHITALPDADDAEQADTKIVLPGGNYAFIYRHTSDSKVLLAVAHVSRLPKAAVNS